MLADSSLGPWKVGELAKLTGITVRTLHHYDEIGLLIPSHHTQSGHRLYTRTEVARLHQIVTLRHLGFSLEQVRETLDRADFSPLETVKALRAEIRQRQIELEELEDRLGGIQQLITDGDVVSTRQLIEAIEMITMFEKYFTKEQLVKAGEIDKQMRPERKEEIIKTEWPLLIGETQAEMDRGTPPSNPKVRALALRWKKLIEEKTAGDDGLSRAFGRMIDNEPSFATDFVTKMGHPTADLPKLLSYIFQAIGVEPSKGDNPRKVSPSAFDR